MHHRNWSYRNPGGSERACDINKLDFRLSPTLLSLDKDILECLLDELHCIWGTITRHCAILDFVEPADIVKPEDMVGMCVGKKHGIYIVYPVGKTLKPELRRCIDYNLLPHN